MRVYRIALVLVISAAVSACSVLTAPLSSSLKSGEPVPTGKVLVIGKFVLDPDVEQGSLAGMSAGRGTLREVIKLFATRDLSQKIKPDAIAPLSIEEMIDARYPGTTFLPMTPGTRYVRMGEYATSVAGRYVNPASSSMRVAGVNKIRFFSDIKLTIPAGAKAVYIGTVVIRHDYYNATGVSVRDEYGEAMQQLAAMKLDNIKPRDVVKSLATVTGKPLQRRR